MPIIKFSNTGSEHQPAIVVSFDLSGFSKFCQHSDAHAYLPQFISGIFDTLNEFFIGPAQAVIDGWHYKQYIREPHFIKYTGDGALMIWTSKNEAKFSAAFCAALVSAMRKFQQRLISKLSEWERVWPVHPLPNQVRVGIARGSVYGLRGKSDVLFPDGLIDCVGYCINLAVRLQDYCPAAGFLIHAPLVPESSELIKLKAKKLKGAYASEVFAYRSDFANVDERQAKLKFLQL